MKNAAKSPTAEVAAATPWPPEYRQRIVRLIGDDYFACWFSTAELMLGPPAKIVATSSFRAQYIDDHFGGALRRIFGDDLRITHQVKRPCNVEDAETAT